MSAVTAASDQLNPRFTPEEVEFFQENGYIIVRGLAPAELLQRMRLRTEDDLQHRVEPAELEADLQYPGAPESRQATGGGTVRRLLQAHGRGPVFTRWISHPGLTARLSQLLGPNVVMPLAHHNCIMTKQPEFSSDTGWHQDIRYWSFSRPELVSVWLALGAENLHNGCLRLIPGSHNASYGPAHFDSQKFFRTDLPENQEAIDGSCVAELEAGDVLFFHCRTLHSATRNFSNQVKLSIVFTFRPLDNPPVPGTRSASMPEMLLPVVPEIPEAGAAR